MLIAAAAKAATEAHWWDDWPKFLPGWLAFAWTLGVGVRKVWIRRHVTALGSADNELREALTAIREAFEQILARGGLLDHWFTEAERARCVQRLADLSVRRKDRELRRRLDNVLDAWNQARNLAPLANENSVAARVRPRSDDEEHGVWRTRQAAAARVGFVGVGEALNRLNVLERKTLGR